MFSGNPCPRDSLCPEEHLELQSKTARTCAVACLRHDSTRDGTQAETRSQDAAFQSVTSSLKHSLEYREFFHKKQASVFLVRPGEKDVGAGADVPEDLRCDESGLHTELTSE